MPEPQGYYLTKDDRQAIRLLVQQYAREHLGQGDPIPGQCGDVYLARVGDTPLPALTPAGVDDYDHPGVVACDLYQILPSIASGESWDLTPISDHSVPVFNLTESELTTGAWLLVNRTKQGLWVASPTASLPRGTCTNDILYWDAVEGGWEILQAPDGCGTGSGSGTSGPGYILTVIGGVLQWSEMAEFECPSGTGSS